MLLLLPTIAMGATLPVVAHGCSLLFGKVGEPVSRLYGANTFGAVLGTFSGGLLLLPLLGIQATIFTAGIINLLVGLSAYILFRTESTLLTVELEKREVAPAITPFESPGKDYRYKYLLPAYALSGFVSLSCQIIWTRGMILSFGSSVYAFTIVLMTFLAGIAIGSLLYKRIFKLSFPDIETFGIIEIGIGFGIVMSILLIGHLPFLFLVLFNLVQKSMVLIFLVLRRQFL
ncbi:hypothetical protein ACFL27_16145, partial [candidate division CSSED10-310 bacterium]